MASNVTAAESQTHGLVNGVGFAASESAASLSGCEAVSVLDTDEDAHVLVFTDSPLVSVCSPYSDDDNNH